MEKLRIESCEIEIIDYYNWNGAFHIDAKLQGEEEIRKIVSVLDESNGENGMCDFEIGAERYRGYCSNYYYDKQHNIRLIMLSMSDEEYDEECHRPNIFNKNLKKILHNQRSAIEEIVKSLRENGIITEFQEKRIIDYIPEREYGEVIFHMVDNLEEYLKECGIEMKDLKERKQ